MKAFYLKQGDGCKIPICITLNGEPLSPADVEAAEFMLGTHVRRMYPEEVTYEDGKFYFPLTQKETMRLAAGLTLPLDVRVKFIGGEVIGAIQAAQVTVTDAVSRREL